MHAETGSQARTAHLHALGDEQLGHGRTLPLGALPEDVLGGGGRAGTAP